VVNPEAWRGPADAGPRGMARRNGRAAHR